MNDQFVTYEIALALKELGFKEKCLTTYTNKGELSSVWNVDPDICERELLMEYTDDSLYCINGELLLDYISAPLWQQVIDWFREKHQLYISINVEIFTLKHDFEIFIHTEGNSEPFVYQNESNSDNWSLTYEEAREQAILKAIELCKK